MSFSPNGFAPSTDFATMEVNGKSAELDAEGKGGIEVTVPAGGTAELNVRITAPAEAPNLSQYGGYLYAESDTQTVSVPYGGFKGDYQAVRALGDVVFSENGQNTVRQFPAFYDALTDRVYFEEKTSKRASKCLTSPSRPSMWWMT
ncbi:Fn3-like domain-containing protein [Deinococcus radiophilus]|uniref:Fn3-like domain-containing protein n=1 Tax=Deinococcus radiophilus TaxID=32062 RepID=UPI003616B161